MTRIILVALVLLSGARASAQSDSPYGPEQSISFKSLQEAGIAAQESKNWGLAESLFTTYLEWNYNKDIMSRLGTVRLLLGDTVGFCTAMGTPGIKGDIYETVCTTRDSMEFIRSGLPSQTYYGTHSVTRKWDRGTGSTSYVLYDEKGEVLTSFFTIDSDTVYRVTDQKPEFPGGSEKMYDFLQKNLVYPTSARDANIQGRVYVEFIIRMDGRITNVRVLRGVCRSLDAAAVRAISSMPNWTPGYYQGGPVSTTTFIPINFTFN